MKFNANSSTRTTNLAGGKAFKQTNKLEVLGILLTSFLKDSFYESSDETLERLEKVLEAEQDKVFLAKAALYARTVFGMRSVSHVVAVHLARNTKGMKDFFGKIVYRPDDMLEIASYFFMKYKTTLPNAVKKGFAKALERFDEYRLAKYRGEGKAVSMVDLVNLVHPRSTPALSKLIHGELHSTETWESKLSTSLKDAKTDEEKHALKKKAWTSLVLEKKLGYFALLRNLRNILECAPELDREVAKQLTDKEKIKSSLVLPFRFMKALDAVKERSNRVVFEGVVEALDLSVSNVKALPGKTLIVMDCSGSMQDIADKASIFAAALYKANTTADLMFFDESAFYITTDGRAPIYALADSLKKAMRGGGTNFHAIFQVADKPYDNIVILSDMQGWMEENNGYYTGSIPGSFAAYKKKHNCNPKLFSFDLAGYGSLQFPEPEVFLLAGISEKTFDIMAMLGEDKNALLHTVDAMPLEVGDEILRP